MLRLAILAAILASVPALAHDNPTNWIGEDHLKNAKQELCCGKNDCKSYLMSEIKQTSTGYILPNGDTIPYAKVAPSADGFFWSCEWGGERKCSFAPIGGT